MIPDLPPEQCDYLALGVQAEHRVDDLNAMQTRWWDYRLLHPTEATYLYASHYTAMHKAWHVRCIEERDAGVAKAFDHQDIFHSRDLTAVWLARQFADRLGMPYEFVMEFALQRALLRAFRHPLRPNQLYSEEFEGDLLPAWQDSQRRTLRTASNAFLLAGQYQHHPLQDEYRRWLLERIEARPAPRHRLIARLHRDGAVNDDFIRGAFGDLALSQVHGYLQLLADPGIA